MGHRIDEYASFSSMDEILLWVTFLNSLEISNEKEGFPTSTRMPTTITIYYTTGKQDVIDYGYSDLYYNKESYAIGRKNYDYSIKEYMDCIIVTFVNIWLKNIRIKELLM